MRFTATLLGCAIAASILFGPRATAATFAVQDVSNVTLSCNNEFMSLLGIKGCFGYGPGALNVTITTAPGEFPLACQWGDCAPGYDVYVVVLYQGTHYLLTPWEQRMAPLTATTAAQPTFPWELPFTALNGSIPYSRAYTINPLWGDEGQQLRNLPLTGMEIYVGLTPTGQQAFNASRVQQIWPRPSHQFGTQTIMGTP